MWWQPSQAKGGRTFLLAVLMGCAFAAGAPAQTEGDPAPLGWGKDFQVDPIVAGGTTTLLFAISNSNSDTVDMMAFSDNLPATLEVVAAGPNGCGGTVTATPGTSTISLDGGSISANTICALHVTVTGSTPGVYVNVTGDLTSSAGNSGPTTDTLTVEEPPETSLEIPTASTLGLLALAVLLTMAGTYLAHRRAGRR